MNHNLLSALLRSPSFGASALVANATKARPAAAQNPLRWDPAGLVRQRAAFYKDFSQRIASAGKEIQALLADPALLVLRAAGDVTTNSLDDFRNDPSLLSKFRKKLQEIIRRHLFARLPTSLVGSLSYWWEKHTKGAYTKGYSDAQNRSSGAIGSPFGSLGASSAGAVKKALLAVERQIGVFMAFANRLSGEIEKVLTSAVVGTVGMAKVLRRVAAVVRLYAGRAARVLASNELQTSYASGQLEAFAAAGVERVVLVVEFLTAGGRVRVCSLRG